MKKISDNITIVIPCKNEENYIASTILSIIEQKDAEGLNIIIADAGSSDKTLEIIESFKYNIQIIPGGLPSIGRNKGVEFVKTPYVLFLDADASLTNPNILKKCNDIINNKKPLLISSTPKYKGNSIINSILFGINNIVMTIMANYEPFAIGGFFLTSIDEFKRLGQFDPLCCNAEDWRLSRKYKASDFVLLSNLIIQDDRRFNKFGRINMLRLMFTNWLNRNNDDYFRKDVGYF